jgi:hypothetical protein
MKKVLFTFFLVLFTVPKLTSQTIPCDTSYPYLAYEFDYLKQYPPYSLDMPYDVLLAYVALDSISYYSNAYAAKLFLDRQTFNDTLKTIMKYYYKMVDFDPVRYQESRIYNDPNIHSISIGMSLERYIESTVKEISPFSKIDYPLIRSNYILHVKVKGIIDESDSSRPFPISSFYQIKCQILDTIKGKRIPLMHFPANQGGIINNSKSNNNNNSIQQPFLPDSSFDYTPGWSGGLWNDDGTPLLKIGGEYIVFLDGFVICYNTEKSYFEFRPAWPEYPSFLFFAIKNGNINDPSDSFGFGKNISVIEWKNKLRQRINEILNY